MMQAERPSTPMLNRLIQRTLSIGLFLSLALMVIGAVMLLFHPAAETVTTMPLSAVLSGLAAGNPLSFLLAGIILLMLTPAVRVVIAAIGYVLEGDYWFAGVSAVVVCVLLVSILIGAS